MSSLPHFPAGGRSARLALEPLEPRLLLNGLPTVGPIERTTHFGVAVNLATADFAAAFSDPDPGDTLQTVRILMLPVNGTLALGEVQVVANQEIAAGDLGGMTYTPLPGFVGADSFGWNGSDGQAYAEEGSTYTITMLNEAPTVGAIGKAMHAGGLLNFAAADFTGVFNDQDPEDSLQKVRFPTLPAHGALFLSGVPVLVNQQIAASQLGTLTYAPAEGFVGTDDFTWNGSDGVAYALLGGDVSVAASDLPPTVGDVQKEAHAGTTMGFTAADFAGAFSDPDPEDSLRKVKVVGLPGHGTLRLRGTPVAQNQEIRAAELAEVTYVPAQGFVGGDSFGWNGSDGTLYAATSAGVVITLTNQAPAMGSLDTLPGGFEDADFAVTYLMLSIPSRPSDPDGDSVGFRVEALTSGTLLKNGEPVVEGATVLGAGETLVWRPAQSASGLLDAFTVKAWDGFTTSAGPAVQVRVAVQGVNDAPSFTKGADVAVAEDAGPQAIPAWATGVTPGPPDEAGQSVWFEATLSADDARLFAAPPTVSADGTLAFTPRGNANGMATVTLVLHDDGGVENGGADTSAAQTFTITLQPVLRYVGSIPVGATAAVHVYDTDRTPDVTLGNVVVKPGSGGGITSITLAGAGTVGGLGLVITGATAVGAIADARLGVPADVAFVVSPVGIKSLALRSGLAGYDLNGLTLNGMGFAADIDGDGNTNDVSGLVVGGKAGSLSLGGRVAADVMVGGLISKLAVAEWSGGGLSAGGVGSLTSAGDFGADALTLTGAGVAAGKSPLPKAAIAGGLTGAWTARSIQKLSVGGDIVDFALTLTQAPDPKVLALGSLTAAGGLYRSRILAAGSIGKVAMAAMEDSAIFAGVGTTRDANGDGVLDLPNPAGDIVGVGASIASLRLNGLFVGGAPADSFANSSVAAGLLKAIVLPKVRKANNWPFGLAARRILSLNYEGVALKLPAPFQDSAFELRIA